MNQPQPNDGWPALRQLVRPTPEIYYPDDVALIRKALNTLGYDASDIDIQAAYEDYSENEMAAGWIVIGYWIPPYEGAAKAVMRYLTDASSPLAGRAKEGAEG